MQFSWQTQSRETEDSDLRVSSCLVLSSICLCSSSCLRWYSLT